MVLLWSILLVEGRVRLYFATRNSHKLEEAKTILAPTVVEQLNEKKVEIRSEDLEEIAMYAAQGIRESFRQSFFVEDSGLFVQALKGYPGPYSSGIFRLVGLEGLVKLMYGVADRSATFRSVVAFSAPETGVKTFAGEVHGSISEEPHGEYGFDYDPVFIPEQGDGRTFGEMTLEEKSSLSHRARSLTLLRKFLRGLSG